MIGYDKVRAERIIYVIASRVDLFSVSHSSLLCIPHAQIYELDQLAISESFFISFSRRYSRSTGIKILSHISYREISLKHSLLEWQFKKCKVSDIGNSNSLSSHFHLLCPHVYSLKKNPLGMLSCFLLVCYAVWISETVPCLWKRTY